jgi:hypothetical protein
MGLIHGLAGSANPHPIDVIAPRGEMESFPIGTTPFLLEIHVARGSSAQDIPHALDDAAHQKAGRYLPIRLIRGLIAAGVELTSLKSP